MGTGGSKELALVEGIKEQLTISNVISLQGNHLDETSVGVLSSMLRDPHVRGRVRHLRVGGCGINGMGLQRIAEALCIATEPCKLKRLDLVSCICNVFQHERSLDIGNKSSAHHTIYVVISKWSLHEMPDIYIIYG